MKKLFLATTAIVALIAGPAMAADMRVKAPPPPPPPPFSWTGCYIGVHAGGGWQVSSYTTQGGGDSGVGVLGGAQAGCNSQWRQFVIGVEGEFWGSSLYDRRYFQEGTFTFDAYSRNRWDAAISVRSGVAIERAFIYGKLGAVWGKFDYSTDRSFSNGSDTERGDAIFTGVLIGVGFEYALTDNWTTKFEYNYIDYGNKIVNFTFVDCNPGCVTGSFSAAIKEVKQIVKLGVNYKF
jgi:outer membrane immunogenic protein